MEVEYSCVAVRERENPHKSRGEGICKILYQAYHMLKQVNPAEMLTCRQISNLSILPTKSKKLQISRLTDSRFGYLGHSIEQTHEFNRAIVDCT